MKDNDEAVTDDEWGETLRCVESVAELLARDVAEIFDVVRFGCADCDGSAIALDTFASGVFWKLN